MDTAIARPELLLVADAVAREKIDRPRRSAGGDGAGHPEGRPRQVRAREGHPRHDRPQDRRRAPVALDRGGRDGRERGDADPAQHRPQVQAGHRGRRVHLVDPLPPIDFGRIAAQTAKQVIVQRVREYERKRQYDEFKDRVGEIINGVVKRTEYGNLMVELGRAEALLRRDELIPRESFRNGDRVRAYIYDVREEPRGPQIFLSRTHPAFLAKLFAQEVPEIYDGIIEIKAVARDPGSRAKMAVISRDSSDRPGRRLRRHARLAGAGGGAGTAGREDRHHPLVAAARHLRGERAGAGRGDQGGDGRGGRPRRGRGAGRAAVASPSAAAARTCGSRRSSPAGTSTS